MTKLPRGTYEEVIGIEKDDSLSIDEKSQKIHSFCYSRACMETNGRLPPIPSAASIKVLLEKRVEERKELKEGDIPIW